MDQSSPASDRQTETGGTPDLPASTMRVERNGCTLILTLNRPKALNALNEEMRAQIIPALTPTIRDPEIYAVILKSESPKAFCAGGDVRELIGWAATDTDRARKAFADEYRLDWALRCYCKPSVSLADGFVMGSGAGLTLYNTHRVGGEKYAFAMPETAIGFFPDVGVANILARLPDHIGIYLGLTGARIDRHDAYHLGLLTHLISAEHFPEIQTKLADAWPIDDILDDLHEAPQPGQIMRLRNAIGRCFSARNLEAIVAQLGEVAQEGDVDPAIKEWAERTLGDLSKRSPTALKVTLQHIRAAANQDLSETLMTDYRLAVRFLDHPDFTEGVRAALIDKDGAPKWSPAQLSDVFDTDVAGFFAPLGEQELHLASRTDMQDVRRIAEFW